MVGLENVGAAISRSARTGHRCWRLRGNGLDIQRITGRYGICMEVHWKAG